MNDAILQPPFLAVVDAEIKVADLTRALAGAGLTIIQLNGPNAFRICTAETAAAIAEGRRAAKVVSLDARRESLRGLSHLSPVAP